MDRTLTGTLNLSRPGSNDNEGVLNIPQNSRTGVYQMQFSVIPMTLILFDLWMRP